MSAQPSPEPPAVDRLVDWGVASATARRLVRPGPEVSAREAAEIVAALREDAAVARGHVAAVTGLDAPAVDAQVLVVDRPGWIDANLRMLRSMLEPVVDRLAERRMPSALISSVGSRVTGAEAGAPARSAVGKGARAVRHRPRSRPAAAARGAEHRGRRARARRRTR